jgi:tripartite ATP-independent transporter DctM subunit
MDFPIIVMACTFVVMLLLNVPIAVSIGLATLFMFLAVGDLSTEQTLATIAQKMYTGTSKFPLLAIPFFILSGLLMGRGGIAGRLVDFAATLVGRFRGGLAYVNVVTCMLFGSISGSAVAAVSSVGGFMIPEMNKNGYDRDFNVAVTTTAATTGLMIPPSNVMIVYSMASGSVSIAALFFAGVLPGILFGIFLMAVCWVISVQRDYGAGDKAGLRDVLIAFKRALLSLLLVVIVLGGILGGVFTPTEAAAIAVVYSFVLSVLVYREVKLYQLPRILLESGITTSVVMLLIGVSSSMSWILAIEGVPKAVSAALLAVSENKFVIFLLINLLLLFVGTFMDMVPAILIFTPIFLPVVEDLGMNPVHFGIMMIANLCIGLCTPPVGTCLFVGCGVGKTTIAKVTGPLIPFFFAMAAALMLITYVPKISLWLPELTGLIKSAP